MFQLLKYEILHVQGVRSLFVCCSLSKAGVDNSCLQQIALQMLSLLISESADTIQKSKNPFFSSF